MTRAGAIGVIAADETNLTDVAAAFCEGDSDGLDDLMVVDFIEQGVVTLDGGSLKELGDVAIGESDFEVAIDNENALADLAEEGFEEAAKISFAAEIGEVSGEFFDEARSFVRGDGLAESTREGEVSLLPLAFPVPGPNGDSAEKYGEGDAKGEHGSQLSGRVTQN